MRYGIAIIIFLNICSCQELVFEKSIPGQWSYENPFFFSVEISDTTDLKSMVVEIEHSNDYPYQNIYLKSTTILPTMDTLEDVFSIDLADKYGAWKGDCSFGSCLLQNTVQQNFRFQQKGTYKFQFEQYTRTDSLPGILGVRCVFENPA